MEAEEGERTKGASISTKSTESSKRMVMAGRDASNCITLFLSGVTMATNCGKKSECDGRFSGKRNKRYQVANETKFNLINACHCANLVE